MSVNDYGLTQQNENIAKRMGENAYRPRIYRLVLFLIYEELSTITEKTKWQEKIKTMHDLKEKRQMI